MMSNDEYFSNLYEIASALNKEFSLHSALKKALAKTVDLLGLETGWIWLLHEDRSVYLGASYNLPPALRDHPERLSGRCYCIEKYLSGNIDEPLNISEVACTRLRSLDSGTMDLKFHATIPIKIGNEKAGLINILSKESQQLNNTQLCLLNTVGELIGIVIQRTRAMETAPHLLLVASPGYEVLYRVIPKKLEDIISRLQSILSEPEMKSLKQTGSSLNSSLQQAEELKNKVLHILEEIGRPAREKADKPVRFPSSPLSDREIEILALVKKGYTNKQIAETIFISERTVKFHITSILSKLSARTRTEAVDIAFKRGLIGL